MSASSRIKPKYNAAAYRMKMDAQRERQRKKEQQRESERARHLSPDLVEVGQQFRNNYFRMKKYIRNPRYVKSDVTRDILLKEMLPSDAPFLVANNIAARMRFYHAWFPHIMNFGFNKRAFHVTLAPMLFARPISQAAGFNIFQLQQWASFVMRGFDLVGMVEAGHHSHVYPITTVEPWISFHTHMIVVIDDNDPAQAAAELSALKDRIVQINEKYPAFRPTKKTAHVTVVKNLSYLAGYLVKEQNTDYRIPPPNLIPFRKDGGGVGTTSNSDPETRKPKRGTLSPGLQLKMWAVTRGWYLDKMIFAGKSGVPVMKAIRHDALSALPWSKRSDRERLFSGCFEPDPEAPRERYDGFLHSMRYFDLSEHVGETDRRC